MSSEERRRLRDLANEPTEQPGATKEPIDVFRGPVRSRQWEREQRGAGRVVTYRGIPPELHEQLKQIAGGLGVPVGEVARAFLEHGLSEFQSGALKLRPAEIVTKSTLYPDQV